MADHREPAGTGAKAEGDDQGKALEINDRTEHDDEPDLESRSGDGYQGKALQINQNSKGDTK